MSLILDYTPNKPNCFFGLANDLISIGLNTIRLADFCENVYNLIYLNKNPVSLKLKETILELNKVKGFNPGNYRLEGKKLNNWFHVNKDENVNFPVLGTTLQINLYDFYELVYYVMTNTDLMTNDPRIQLIQELKGN